MNANEVKLSRVCLWAGFASILGSIIVWGASGGRDKDAAHAERFGIFIGLWAPTFFILSERFERSERSGG
ncbi:hypothetical protein [Deinococcus yavapaiensis]|uniref:Uncharacterized protein n=1 Tax=Deinococcus yavapaiensis KR-236 TaxID=694435 RepID=A0A318SAQ4_9DEIO|nr:hypothetical protein [Deinococcus yavapaiensis]PYE56500.1 hypothetical protein DES52_101304 [Deinococcus yavapaiensis KR-236]